MIGVFIRRRKGIQIDTESSSHVKWRPRLERGYTSRIARSHQKLEKRHKTNLSSRKEPTPPEQPAANTLISNFWPSEL